MFAWLRLASLIAALILSGCSVPLTDPEIRASEEGKLLLTVFDALQTNDLDSVRSHMSEQAKKEPGFEKAIEYMAEIIPDREKSQSEFLGWWVNVDSTNGRTSGATAQFEFSDKWILVTATYTGKPSTLSASSYQVQYAQKLPDGASPFTSGGNSAFRYISLTSAAAATIVSLASFMICIMSKGLRRKWLWAIFTILGVSGVYFSPSTGDYLLNFWDFGGFDGSWYLPADSSALHIVAPVGALIFLWRRHRQAARVEKPLDIGPLRHD